MELGTAFVTIEADQTKLTAGLNKAQKNVSASMKTIGRNMALAGAAITGAFAMALKTASQFEQSMANTASVAGATTEELKKLSDYARKMGEQSVFSASQAADAMYYLASAGMNTNEIMGALKGTLDLSAATASDLAFASEITAASLSQFGLDADEAGRVANVFAATISKSQATLDKLAISMSYVGPLANSMGMEIEDVAGILGNLYNAGIEASTAGTSLREMFAKLIEISEKGSPVFDELGVSILDTSGKMKPFAQIVDELGEAGLTAGQAFEVFGKRAGPNMLALIGQGKGAIGELTESVTGTNKAAEMAAMQIDTFQGAMKLLKSAFEELQITLVQDLMPALKGTIEWITEGVKKVTEWMKANPELTGTIVKWTAAIGALMLVLGPLLMILPGLVTGVGLLTSPIVLVVAAAGALYLAFTNWDKLVEIVGNIASAVVAKISEWAGAINTWWDNIVANTDNKWILVADKIMDAVKGVIKWVAETIGEWISDIFGWWNNIEKDADSVWGKIVKVIIDSVKAWIKFFADTLPGWILDVIKFFTDFKTKSTKVWDDIKKNITKIAKALMDFVEDSFDRLDDVIKIVKDWVEKTVKFIKDLKVTAIREVKELIDGIFKKFEDLADLPGKMLEWGKNAITGFTDGIKNKMSSVTDAVKGVGEKIKGFLGFESPPKEGPLSTSDKWMPNMMGMFGAGITDNTSAVLTPVDKLATLFEDRMARLRENVDIETGGMMNDMETAVKDAIPKILTPTETLAREFLSVWDNLKTDFKTNIVDPIVGYLEDQLAYAITGLLGGVEDFEWSWKSFWEGLKDILIKAVAAMIAKLVVLAAFSWLFNLLGIPVGWLGINKGGEVEAKNEGGEIEGFAKGGSSTDTVPAMLTPGEYVISKPMVDFIKRTGAVTSDLVSAIRTGARTPTASFAGGGGVGASSNDNRKTYSSTIQIQPGAIIINTPKFSSADGQELFRQIEKQARMRGLAFGRV